MISYRAMLTILTALKLDGQVPAPEALLTNLQRNPLLVVTTVSLGVFFVVFHVSLSAVIRRAKLGQLRNLQREIAAIAQVASAGDDITRAQWLIERHEPLRAARETSFNVRAATGLCTSLLLPAGSFLLSNLNRIRELLHRAEFLTDW